MSDNWLEALVKDGTVTVAGPTVPWPDGYDPHADRPDLKRVLGGLVIDWLNRADEQGPDAKRPGGVQRQPADGCWRDAGWRAAAEIIRKAFAGRHSVHLLRPGDVVPLTTDRRAAFPDEFLADVYAQLAAERQRWQDRDGSHFHGATGALDCCLRDVTKVRQEYTCRHEWGPVLSRRYCRDEPPEPDYRRCERCGAERDEAD